MEKYIDFDRFLQEKEEKTIRVRVYGEDVEVRSEIPMMVPMMLARASGGASGVMSEQEAGLMVFRAADIMFGHKTVDRFCEQGMSTEELKELMGRIFAASQGGEEEEEGAAYDDETGRRAVRKTKNA